MKTDTLRSIGKLIQTLIYLQQVAGARQKDGAQHGNHFLLQLSLLVFKPLYA